MTGGKSPEGPLYPIASVDNALRLLLMLQDRQELRLSEAAAELEVATSTAHRVLAMLAHRGLVRQDLASKIYYAGPALYEIGLALVRRLDAGQQVRWILETVAHETGETVHAGILEGRPVVRYIDAIESDRALRVASRTGMTLPAHCSAAGKALLAALDPPEVDELYGGVEVVRTTPASVRSLAALRDVLEVTRQRGYAENREESEEGVVAVGVAYVPTIGDRSVGISCAAPKFRMSKSRAREIGQLLGEVVGRTPDASLTEPHDRRALSR